eukprot:TRINITY_DN540_c0_g3_i2.p2 TRINITY_DN540_c0_g3~~TRINITY_DN540_c0_g3_i2.p2  ORF type:complete len:189 (+),score=28.97 TRINITY_DN540_c0_g3_i2:52-618(+)
MKLEDSSDVSQNTVIDQARVTRKKHIFGLTIIAAVGVGTIASFGWSTGVAARGESSAVGMDDIYSSEEDMALFVNFASGIANQMSACPLEVIEEMKVRDAGERDAEFAATWGAADTDGDDLLNEAEFVDFVGKIIENDKMNYGCGADIPEDERKGAWTAMKTLCPDAAGVSIAEYGRFWAVVKEISGM